VSAALEHWPPRVRAMADSDLDAVAAIEKRAYEFPWSRGIFVDCLAVPYVCEVLEEGDRVIGYGIMSLAADEAHLLNLCIDIAAQSRGLGGYMLDHLLRRAAEAGARVLYLEVRPTNARAIALYRRAGFVRIGMRRNYYRAASGHEDALVLARSL
jgi:[ribosomal protein S18]-alanine N-acetyltransferase